VDDPGYLQPGKKYLLTATMTFPNGTHLDADFDVVVGK
jgi:hypothetical protein